MTSAADWIIDLGPEAWSELDPGARNGGGQIVAAGTPEELAATKGGYTGQFLKPVLARGALSKRTKRVEAAK
jgi:excinuclease ABC subunit A